MADLTDPRELMVSTRVRRLEGGDPPHLDPALTRVRRGYFRATAAELTASEQYRMRIFATADARPSGLTFSHASAAELWGCPQLLGDTSFVHATQPGRARRTTAGVRVHRSAIPDEHLLVLDSGLAVTSPAWTAVQLAATGALPGVLLPLDHLVRAIGEERGDDTATVVDDLVAMVPPRLKGGARAVRHLRLADARSGSAGESLSRGQMVLLGVPMPELQVRLPRADEPGEDVLDFDWPELGVFGEFDGQAKYVRQEYTQGRTPDQVLWDEKAREDRIRRHRPRGARWGWRDALSRDRLGQILARAGVLPVRKVSP
jgi:hypothetical protein